MVAPRVRCATPVLRPLLDSLWLPSGDPVSDSFLVRLGGGFGTHFGAHLERLKYPVKESCTRKLRSFSQPGKLPLHASQAAPAIMRKGTPVFPEAHVVSENPFRPQKDNVGRCKSTRVGGPSGGVPGSRLRGPASHRPQEGGSDATW